MSTNYITRFKGFADVVRRGVSQCVWLKNLLKTIAQHKGVSKAEIIRQASNLHIGCVTTPQTNIAAWETELAFINSMKNLLAVKLVYQSYKYEEWFIN